MTLRTFATSLMIRRDRAKLSKQAAGYPAIKRPPRAGIHRYAGWEASASERYPWHNAARPSFQSRQTRESQSANYADRWTTSCCCLCHHCLLLAQSRSSCLGTRNFQQLITCFIITSSRSFITFSVFYFLKTWGDLSLIAWPFSVRTTFLKHTKI